MSHKITDEVIDECVRQSTENVADPELKNTLAGLIRDLYEIEKKAKKANINFVGFLDPKVSRGAMTLLVTANGKPNSPDISPSLLPVLVSDFSNTPLDAHETVIDTVKELNQLARKFFSSLAEEVKH